LSETDQAKSVAMRFQAVSTVKFDISTRSDVGGCCGHNFLFAGKVCADESCDSCPIKTFCTLSDWESWSECPQTCGGGGQMQRSRMKIVQPMESGEEVSSCNGALVEAFDCNNGPCDAQNCAPVDCEYGDWSAWSECSKCGGQRTRTREVKTPASCNGRQCTPEDSKSYEACPENCDSKMFCVWSDWTLGACMKNGAELKCGTGTRERSRKLVHSHRPPMLEAMVKKYEELPEASMEHVELLQELEGLKVARRQGLFAAFAAGLVAFAGVALVVSRRRPVAYGSEDLFREVAPTGVLT
jgi:hypothetical protein